MSESETTVALPFRIDRDYDEDRASNGTSRYGHYVREAAGRDRYAWDMDEPADRRHEFAELAWRAATGPVMAPGFVRYHHLVSGARVYRSGWDGSLLASVTLLTSPPAGLAKLYTWRDWPTELEGDHYRPVGPYEEQIGKMVGGGYALTTVDLAFPLADASHALPDLPDSPEAADLTHIAATAVGVLVGALNDIVGPVLATL